MTPTSLLDDGSPGDTTTGVSTTDSTTFSGSCGIKSAQAYITAVADFGVDVVLLGFQFTLKERSTTFTASICLVGPGDPFRETTWAEEVEYSTDGSTWTTIPTTALATATGTVTKTGISVTARYLRVVVWTLARDVEDVGTITATTNLSDLRTTVATSLSLSKTLDALTMSATIEHRAMVLELVQTLGALTLSSTIDLPPAFLAQGECEGEQVTLTWNALSWATGYQIWRRGTTIDVGNVTSYVDDGTAFDAVLIGVPRKYFLRAYSATYTSGWSAVGIFTPCPVSLPSCVCAWDEVDECP